VAGISSNLTALGLQVAADGTVTEAIVTPKGEKLSAEVINKAIALTQMKPEERAEELEAMSKEESDLVQTAEIAVKENPAKTKMRKVTDPYARGPGGGGQKSEEVAQPLLRTTTGGVQHLTRHYGEIDENRDESKGFGGFKDKEAAKEELEQWKSLATQQEHEMDLAFERVNFQHGQIDALKSAVDKLKDKLVQTQQRYAKELSQQGRALVEMKEQAQNDDTKNMVKRMVDMARQIADLTKNNKEQEEYIESVGDDNKDKIKSLQRHVTETEATAMSKVEKATKDMERLTAESSKAMSDLEILKVSSEEEIEVLNSELDIAKEQLENTREQLENVRMSTQHVLDKVSETEEAAQVACAERDLALRGLATYREKNREEVIDDNLGLNELEYKHTLEELKDAKKSGNVEAIEMASKHVQEAEEKLVHAQQEKRERVKLGAGGGGKEAPLNKAVNQQSSSRDESAWAELLQSLPKRTKIKVLTKNAFRKVVGELHTEKVKSPGSDQVPESIFIQEFFHKRYGLEEIADTYLFGFLCSLQKYTPQEMGFENPGIVYYLNRLRAEIDSALTSRKCVIMPVVE